MKYEGNYPFPFAQSSPTIPTNIIGIILLETSINNQNAEYNSMLKYLMMNILQIKTIAFLLTDALKLHQRTNRRTDRQFSAFEINVLEVSKKQLK